MVYKNYRLWRGKSFLLVMKIVVSMIERIQTWVTYIQNSTSPSVSLLLYIMNDLIVVCDEYSTSRIMSLMSLI